MAGVSPDFTFSQQQKRLLPGVQALAPVETGWWNKRHTSKHYQTKHPQEYEGLMKDHTTVAEGRSNVVKAVGGLMTFR